MQDQNKKEFENGENANTHYVLAIRPGTVPKLTTSLRFLQKASQATMTEAA